jgi:hypothetical protein
MSVPKSPPPDRKDTLRAVAWTVSLAGIVVLAILRVDASDRGDAGWRVGAFLGALIGPFVLAALGWLLVQRVIRKRRGFPPWVGLIAVAISGVALGAQGTEGAAKPQPAAGTKPGADPACAAAYGAPPAGWVYKRADPRRRALMMDQMQISEKDTLGRVDISFAVRGGVEAGLLIWVPTTDPGKFGDGVVTGAREVGSHLRSGSAGSTGARVIDGSKGERMTVAAKGCAAVIVEAADAKVADRLAHAVFSG